MLVHVQTLSVESQQVLAKSIENGGAISPLATDRVLTVTTEVLKVEDLKVDECWPDSLDGFAVFDHVSLEVESLESLARLDGVDCGQFVVTQIEHFELLQSIDTREHRDSIMR